MKRILIITFLLAVANTSACMHCVTSVALNAAVCVSGVYAPEQTQYTVAANATTARELKNARFMYDASLWTINVGEIENETVDAQFMHKDGNLRGLALSVREFVPLDEFIEDFVGGMKESAPETKLTSRKDVVVNGVPMTEMTVEMITTEAPITYHGFIHSGAKGVVVVLGLCHGQLFAQVKDVIAGFASGLMVEGAKVAPATTTKPSKKKSSKK